MEYIRISFTKQKTNRYFLELPSRLWNDCNAIQALPLKWVTGDCCGHPSTHLLHPPLPAISILLVKSNRTPLPTRTAYWTPPHVLLFLSIFPLNSRNPSVPATFPLRFIGFIQSSESQRVLNAEICLILSIYTYYVQIYTIHMSYMYICACFLKDGKRVSKCKEVSLDCGYLHFLNFYCFFLKGKRHIFTFIIIL